MGYTPQENRSIRVNITLPAYAHRIATNAARHMEVSFSAYVLFWLRKGDLMGFEAAEAELGIEVPDEAGFSPVAGTEVVGDVIRFSRHQRAANEAVGPGGAGSGEVRVDSMGRLAGRRLSFTPEELAAMDAAVGPAPEARPVRVIETDEYRARTLRVTRALYETLTEEQRRGIDYQVTAGRAVIVDLDADGPV